METSVNTALPAVYIPRLEDVIKASGLYPHKVHNVYLFGSRVYGTNGPDSDWDFIIVANNSVEALEVKSETPGIKYNIHIYTPDKFKADLDWHRINNIECIFAPGWAKLKEDIKFNFVLDRKKLRHSISHASSHSWVKAKKKLELGEYHTGLKSFFHSIRMPMFASQLIRDGELTNFKISNFIWNRLNKDPEKKWEWNMINKEFRVTHNLMLSQFRSLAEK